MIVHGTGGGVLYILYMQMLTPWPFILLSLYRPRQLDAAVEKLCQQFVFFLSFKLGLRQLNLKN